MKCFESQRYHLTWCESVTLVNHCIWISNLLLINTVKQWNKYLPPHSIACSGVSFWNKKKWIKYEHWVHYKVIISGGLRWSLAPRLLFVWGPLTDHAERTTFSAMCKGVLGILHGPHTHTRGALAHTHIETAFTKTAMIQKQVWIPHSCWDHVFLWTDRPTENSLMRLVRSHLGRISLSMDGSETGDSVCFGPSWISVYL